MLDLGGVLELLFGFGARGEGGAEKDCRCLPWAAVQTSVPGVKKGHLDEGSLWVSGSRGEGQDPPVTSDFPGPVWNMSPQYL